MESACVGLDNSTLNRGYQYSGQVDSYTLFPNATYPKDRKKNPEQCGERHRSLPLIPKTDSQWALLHNMFLGPHPKPS